MTNVNQPQQDSGSGPGHITECATTAAVDGLVNGSRPLSASVATFLLNKLLSMELVDSSWSWFRSYLSGRARAAVAN